MELGNRLIPIETKAGRTISRSYFSGLTYWNKLSHMDPKNGFVVYAGNDNQQWSSGKIISWKKVDDIVKYAETG